MLALQRGEKVAVEPQGMNLATKDVFLEEVTYEINPEV